MKAAQINSYGGETVVSVTDSAEKPSAGSGQLLVEVHAAAVNPFDVSIREGLTRQMAELDFPATLGGDFAGIITEVGEDAGEWKTGQAVYGQASPLTGKGSFAEYVPVKASQTALKPQSIDFGIAAALPLASVSAYQALADHIGLKSGQKILIHGAAGGIGSMAVQIAKHLGAYVAGTAKAADADFVKSLGADEVIDYENQDFTQIIKDYDAVFDTVGGDTTLKSYEVLKPGGSLVSMASQGDENLAKQFEVKFISQFTQTTTTRLNAIAKLVDEGKVKPIIDKVFPLDQAAEALEYQKIGSPKGKIVIQVKSD